jgi:hypothetical protein
MTWWRRRLHRVAIGGIDFARVLQTCLARRVARRLRRHERLLAFVFLLMTGLASFTRVIAIDGDRGLARLARRAARALGLVQLLFFGPRGFFAVAPLVITSGERVFAAVGRIAACIVFAMAIMQRGRERIVRSADGRCFGRARRFTGAWRNVGGWVSADARRFVLGFRLVCLRAGRECAEHCDRAERSQYGCR